MKVLFLDFDGVLNSHAFFRARNDRFVPEELDRAAIARLNAIVERTGARVVVSSTWRLGYTRDALEGILRKHGFTGEIVGVTPRLADVDESAAVLHAYDPRGHEIFAWIRAQPEPPEAIAILDDLTEMDPLGAWQVLTSFDTGLLDEHVEAAVALLSVPWRPIP